MAHAADCPHFETRFPWECGCQKAANDEWYQAHIPGQEVSYGNWLISYNPPPIPARNCDWQFCHKDFDGAEDACDDRYGSAASLLAAMSDIDDREADRFDERGCEECSLATPTSCLKARSCAYLDDEALRRRLFDAASKATAAGAVRS